MGKPADVYCGHQLDLWMIYINQLFHPILYTLPLLVLDSIESNPFVPLHSPARPYEIRPTDTLEPSIKGSLEGLSCDRPPFVLLIKVTRLLPPDHPSPISTRLHIYIYIYIHYATHFNLK